MNLRNSLMKAVHCLLDQEPKSTPEQKDKAALEIMTFIREADAASKAFHEFVAQKMAEELSKTGSGVGQA